MKKAAVPSILFAVVLLALGVTAEAQQPKKYPGSGIYRRPMQLVSPLVPRHFGWLCVSCGYIEGQNIAYRVPIWRRGRRSGR